MTIVDIKTAIRHQAVFELRHSIAPLYWDRAGRIVSEILKIYPDWDLDGVDGKATKISNRQTNLVFHYGPSKFDLAQTQSRDVAAIEAATTFATILDQLAAIPISFLEPVWCERLGYREITMFPTSSLDEAQRLVQRLRLAENTVDTIESLGKLSDFKIRFSIERSPITVRVAVSPFEQALELSPSLMAIAAKKAKSASINQRQKFIDQQKALKVIKSFPQFGVLLDMDAFIELPQAFEDVNPGDFVREATKEFALILPVALAARGSDHVVKQ